MYGRISELFFFLSRKLWLHFVTKHMYTDCSRTQRVCCSVLMCLRSLHNKIFKFHLYWQKWVENSTPDVASSGQSTGEGSPLSTCWPLFSNAARDVVGIVTAGLHFWLVAHQHYTGSLYHDTLSFDFTFHMLVSKDCNQSVSHLFTICILIRSNKAFYIVTWLYICLVISTEQVPALGFVWMLISQLKAKKNKDNV